MVVPCFHSESKSTLMKYTSCRQSRSLASRFRPQVLKDLPLSQNPVQRMKKFHWESSAWTWCLECATTNTRQKLQVVMQGKNTRCWYAAAVAWKVGTCFDFHLCVCVCVCVCVCACFCWVLRNQVTASSFKAEQVMAAFTVISLTVMSDSELQSKILRSSFLRQNVVKGKVIQI